MEKKQKGLITVSFQTFESRSKDKPPAQIKVEVWIKETKTSFGHTDYLVTPVAGSGEVWKRDVEVI
jgi:hypothetical protein